MTGAVKTDTVHNMSRHRTSTRRVAADEARIGRMQAGPSTATGHIHTAMQRYTVSIRKVNKYMDRGGHSEAQDIPRYMILPCARAQMSVCHVCARIVDRDAGAGRTRRQAGNAALQAMLRSRTHPVCG